MCIRFQHLAQNFNHMIQDNSDKLAPTISRCSEDACCKIFASLSCVYTKFFNVLESQFCQIVNFTRYFVRTIVLYLARAKHGSSLFLHSISQVVKR